MEDLTISLPLYKNCTQHRKKQQCDVLSTLHFMFHNTINIMVCVWNTYF